MRHETFADEKARADRFDRARAAWDFAVKRGKRPPMWATEEMWDTCNYPARPAKPGVPLLGKAEHEESKTN